MGKIKNVMFRHIPKTAGNSIENSLNLIKARTPGKFIRNFTGEGRYSFGHLEIARRVRNGNIPIRFYESAFKFCFCRNPYDRAVSHYFYARKRHPDKFSPDVSFLDFSRTLGKYGRMFATQSYYTKGLKFDFIGRFENIERDFKYVADKLGVKAELSRENYTKHEPYINYYDYESAYHVAVFYQEDFEEFGYDNRLFPVL